LSAELNVKDRYGDTPLMKAIVRGHTEFCLKLIDKGADVNTKDSFNETPLMKALRAGHAKLCLILIDKGGTADLSDPLIFLHI